MLWQRNSSEHTRSFEQNPTLPEVIRAQRIWQRGFNKNQIGTANLYFFAKNIWSCKYFLFSIKHRGWIRRSKKSRKGLFPSLREFKSLAERAFLLPVIAYSSWLEPWPWSRLSFELVKAGHLDNWRLSAPVRVRAYLFFDTRIHVWYCIWCGFPEF